MGHRSTTLNLVAKHCARALDFYERGAPYDRSVFGPGVAAHACLEDCGKRAGEIILDEDYEPILRATCTALIATGRDFEGDKEPPLSPDVVYAGRDLALSYIRRNPLPTGEYEIGLAVNKEWMPCPYGAEAWLRARIDRKATEQPGLMDDWDSGAVLVIADYKSAWNESGGTIKLQQKIQAVLAWDAWGEGHDSLRVDVVNIRSGVTYQYPIYPRDQEGAALLERWRADITATIESLDAMKGPNGERPASPGPRCFGCPYLAQCEAAKSAASAVYGSDDPVELARSYAVHEAFLASMKPLLQEATAEAPIRLDGAVLGTIPKESKTLTKDAPAVLAAAWNRKTHPDSVEAARALFEGFIMRSGFSRANAEKLLQHLYSGTDNERAKRAKLLTSITTTKTVRRFGVHRESEENGDESEE